MSGKQVLSEKAAGIMGSGEHRLCVCGACGRCLAPGKFERAR